MFAANLLMNNITGVIINRPIILIYDNRKKVYVSLNITQKVLEGGMKIYNLIIYLIFEPLL